MTLRGWSGRVEGDALIFGPSGTQVLLAVAELCVGGAISAVAIIGGLTGAGGTFSGVEVRRPGVLAMVGVAALLGFAGHAAARLRARVTVDAEGVFAQWLWRTRRVGWAEVADVTVISTEHDSRTRRVGPGGFEVGWSPVGSWSIGVVVLTDGTALELPTLVSAARGQGLQFPDQPSPTERKVDELRRFAARHGFEPPEEPVTWERVVRLPPVERWWWSPVSMAALVLVTFGVTGSLTGTLFVVPGLVWVEWHRRRARRLSLQAGSAPAR